MLVLHLKITQLKTIDFSTGSLLQGLAKIRFHIKKTLDNATGNITTMRNKRSCLIIL